MVRAGGVRVALVPRRPRHDPSDRGRLHAAGDVRFAAAIRGGGGRRQHLAAAFCRRRGASADHRRRGIPRHRLPAGAAGPVPAGGTGVCRGAGPVPDGHGDCASAHAGAQRVDPGVAPGGVRPVAGGRARRDPGQHPRIARGSAIGLAPARADQCPCRLGAGRLGPDAGDRCLLSGGAHVSAHAGLSALADAPGSSRFVPHAVPVVAATPARHGRSASLAIRRGARGHAAGGALCPRHALAAVAPAAAPGRCHAGLLARRHAGAAGPGRFLVAVRSAAAAGESCARAVVVRRTRPARRVPLGNRGHAVQDHALPQLAAPAAPGRNRDDAAEYETDDSGSAQCALKCGCISPPWHCCSRQ